MGALSETFEINNNINLYLLEGIEAAHLGDTAASKGRNAGEQFAHIHNVRLLWLKAAAPELMAGLEKVEKEDALNKQFLVKALRQSGAAMNTMIAAAEATGKVKGFKPHATAFTGYICAHEAHHRGQIMMILKENSHAVDKKIQFGLWEWGVR
jgi:uncharacterized damage-inducible protein DinB